MNTEVNTITNAVQNNAVDVNAIFNAMEAFIKQRPELDKANYGCAPGQEPNRARWWAAYRSYQSELRSIGKDRTRAMKALDEARALNPHKPELLVEAFRAFSGRLSLELANPLSKGARIVGSAGLKLNYTAGQYYPTEYRKAAATVLETYIADWKQAYAAAHPQEFVYHTLEDVRAANQQIGNHWFDRSTMRFFNTRIESGLIGGRYFITSERYDDSRPKRYSVRMAKPNGTIDTVGEFQQYWDKADAREAIKDLMRAR